VTHSPVELDHGCILLVLEIPAGSDTVRRALDLASATRKAVSALDPNEVAALKDALDTLHDIGQDVLDQLAVPLTLVGYSFGGVVAFDLACQLRTRGREVRLVLLEPAPFRRDRWGKKLGRHLRAAGELTWPGRVRYVWTKGLGLCWRASTGLTQRVRRVLPRHELEVEIESHSEPGPEPRDGRKVYKDGLVSSLRGYQPPRFTGEAVLAGRPSWLGESRRTWARLVERELDVIPLDASDHLAIMETGDTTAWLDAIKRRHEGQWSRGVDRPGCRDLRPARQSLSMT